MRAEGYRVTAAYEADHWWFRSRRQLVLAQVHRAAADWLGAPINLLDYGCGTGFSLQYLAAVGKVTGADVSEISRQAVAADGRFPYLDLNADLRPWLGQFEVVTALDVLEHIDDDVDGLRRIMQFLKPGGQAIITVPAYMWLWGDEDEISMHKRRYTIKQLRACCRAAGAAVAFAGYFNAAILPAVAAVVWLRKFNRGDREFRSNLQPTSRWLNQALYRLTAAEAGLVGEQQWRLPCGSSIVCRLSRAD